MEYYKISHNTLYIIFEYLGLFPSIILDYLFGLVFILLINIII